MSSGTRGTAVARDVPRLSPRRVVFLSQRVPFPPTRGDKIITYRMVMRLARSYDVHCIAFSHDAEDDAGAATLRERGIAVTTVPYRRLVALSKGALALFGRRPLTTTLLGSRQMSATVDAALKDCDLAVAFSSSMGAFLRGRSGLPRMLHFCELDSDKWRQYSRSTGLPLRWIYAREAKVLLALERQLAREMSTNIVCTSLEADIFRQWIPDAGCTVLRNGIDLDYFRPANEVTGAHGIVFTGVMNYFPNVDGCRWFVDEVLPGVRQVIPDAHFTIVGAHPNHAVLRLAGRDGVSVTGAVPDVRPYVADAAVVVAPLRIARGIQNKVLEGLSMGRPVVGTTVATQGVGGVAGRDYLVADDPVTMASSLVRLLTDPTERRRLAAAGRAFVEREYDWESAMLPLETAAGALLARQ